MLFFIALWCALNRSWSVFYVTWFLFFFSVCMLLVFIFIFLIPLFRIVLCRFNNCYCQLSFNISSLFEALSKKNGNVRKVILVGSHENMQELYHVMTDDPTSGYRVLGYFEDFPFGSVSTGCSIFGTTKRSKCFFRKHAGEINQLYCSLPSCA